MILNISDGYHSISFSFQIEVKNIPATIKSAGTKLLEQKMMVDALTSSIAPGNIEVAKEGENIP